jgi:catalase-peroxidase
MGFKIMKSVNIIASSVLATALSLVAAPAMAQDAGTAMAKGQTNKDWWPKSLDLTALRQHEDQANPYGPDYNYARAFATLDLDAVKADIRKVLHTSQPWWPSDYGNYGPFFIRMAWHSAGTYRVGDGRGGSDGGEQRFEPLNSWPDNVSLDKARRLVWPIKQKYGRKLSWGDLMVLTGNVALEDMGFKTIGFAGGRIDAWQPDVVYWGPETKMLADQRRDARGNLKGPLASVQMGLIYVNPEGPNGNGDPVSAAADIRRAFGNMAMNDEETLALIAGGHTFGKAHGAHKPDECLGADPASAGVEQQGLGWKNTCGKGNAEDTITSGLEGAWSAAPTRFTQQYIDNLLNFTWVRTKSPAGAIQWTPTDPAAAQMVPDAHLPGVFHAPMMFTTDIALKEDPAFRKILVSWQKNPDLFAKAFARAWFKLTHRDLGPQARYLGKDIPTETFAWQDPLPKPTYALIDQADAAQLEAKILASGLTGPELVRTAWASASTFRGPTCAAAPMARASAFSPSSAGRSTTRPNCSRSRPGSTRSARPSTRGDGRQAGFAGRSDRAGRRCGGRAGRGQGWLQGYGGVHAGPCRRHPGPDRHHLVRLSRTQGRWLPQLLFGRGLRGPGFRAGGQGRHAEPHRPGNDRAGRWHAGSGRECGRLGQWCVHQPSRRAEQRLFRQPALDGHGLVEVGPAGPL